MYKVIVTEKGDRDLDNIVFYITNNLAAPQAASAFLDEVHACYDRLEENPYIFEACRDLKLLNEGYRRAVIKNYIMIYAIREADYLVIVHRFFYGRQNYINLI